ncbi:uncharacterized protein BYT42DRAFT_582536 [Radiomyces spectabilis]|uniref:uncharacterized protein n=1 Tax=Radiomyces spectabilis TaxID=64574 RepID=UPI00221FD827|nr:uncharacterized protein BYT42DRAFT_582536 [Radiomyces spectabilis]KAI8370469.1 hypothetical protein BYT42DRAFT_582536 [Radiomyces spectabilis]
MPKMDVIKGQKRSMVFLIYMQMQSKQRTMHPTRKPFYYCFQGSFLPRKYNKGYLRVKPVRQNKHSRPKSTTIDNKMRSTVASKLNIMTVGTHTHGQNTVEKKKSPFIS